MDRGKALKRFKQGVIWLGLYFKKLTMETSMEVSKSGCGEDN